jgi:MFS family permease
MPRGRVFHGWWMVAALSVTEMVSWGILFYAFAVFLRPVEEALGASRAQVSGAFSLGLLLAGCAALPAGRWVDRHGARGLMTLGSCAAALLLFAWSRVESLAGLYAVQAGLGLAMAALLYEPAFAAVANWFFRFRGRALLIVTLMGGLASFVFLPVTERLVSTLGWREALRILALVMAGVTLPLHFFVLRRRPADLGLRPDGDAGEPRPGLAGHEASGVPLGEALRSRPFRWLAAAMMLSVAATSTVAVHLLSYLAERGLPGALAASAAGAIGLMQLPGRVLFAPASERAPQGWATAGVFLLQAAGLALLLAVPGMAGIVLFVVVFGMGQGMSTLVRASKVAEIFGLAAYGGISGALALCTTVARTLAPLGAALLHDSRGSYQPVFWLLAIGALGAAGSGWLAERSRPLP